jgi:hypothetical protein
MHRILSVSIGSSRRPRIVLQVSQWSGIIRLMMRGYWSLEGIEAQGYRDVAITHWYTPERANYCHLHYG